MSINIHGKEYITVAERVKAIHENEKSFSIETELVSQNPVVIKATVKTPKGTFTGISYANFDKAIEKQSPYEVAETSAVGRALGFAGYGIVEDIASADEMIKAGVRPDTSFANMAKTTIAKETPATLKQREAVVKIASTRGEEITFEDTGEWTFKQASDYIGNKGNGGYRTLKATA